VFQEMLEDLEAKSEELKLLNYGISLTTMEEVFMKVGSDYTNDENDEIPTGDLQNGHANSCKNLGEVCQLKLDSFFSRWDFWNSAVANWLRADRKPSESSLQETNVPHITELGVVLATEPDSCDLFGADNQYSTDVAWKRRPSTDETGFGAIPSDGDPPTNDRKRDGGQFRVQVSLTACGFGLHGLIVCDSSITESYREMFKSEQLQDMTEKNMTEYYLQLVRTLNE
jgi:hypothetical protein